MILANPTPPDFQSRLDDHSDEVLIKTNCHEVGRITAFDPAKQTASVQIMVLRLVNGQPTQYPLLTDCPVFLYSGGTAYLSMPIAVGDPCLVCFNDRDIDIWFTTGNVTAPNSSRLHSLSDGMVLVGFRNLAKPVAGGVSTTDARIVNGTAVIGATPTKIDLHNAAGGAGGAGDLLFTALLTWVNTGGTTPNPATVTAITAAKTAWDALFV